MVDQVTDIKDNPRKSLTEMAAEAQKGMIDRVNPNATSAAKELVRDEAGKSAGIQRNMLGKKEESEWYFQSNRPGFGFMYRVTHKQVKFIEGDGTFFKTSDRKLAQTIRNSYGTETNELSKEQYEEAIVLKPGAPEPVKSSIVVTKLPG